MDNQNRPLFQALWQVAAILAISLALGMGYNHLRSDRMPTFCDWSEDPEEMIGPASMLDISLAEAAQLFHQNRVVFLDARPPDQYESEHIQGAYNLPCQNIDEICFEFLDELLMEKTIIAYCDGATCDLGEKLATFLCDMGFEDVHVLSNGLTRWKRRNLPTVSKGA
jgi:rhodanese-related sulfurtransferase